MVDYEEQFEKLYKKISKKKMTYENIKSLNLEDVVEDLFINYLLEKNIVIDYSNKDIAIVTSDIERDYIRKIENNKLLTKEEEQDLFRRYIESGRQDKELFEQIFEANLRLVVSIANRRRTWVKETAVDFMDLVQEGNIGLMIAIDEFDVEKGYKFSTYATNWISSKVGRYLKNTTGYTFSASGYDRLLSIRRVENDYLSKTGLEVSDEQLADILNTSFEKIKELRHIPLGKVSMDEFIPGFEDLTYRGFVKDETINIEEEVVENLYYEELNDMFEGILTQRQKEVIDYIFGFNGRYPSTGKEIAKKLNLTLNQVNSLRTIAYKKIKAKVYHDGKTLRRKCN